MSRALLVDTPIEVSYLPPKRLPINRIPSWLNKNRTEPLDVFDAIVNISALRPELQFYTSVRSANIHAVPIDIAEALLPGGERVAVHQTDEYFWLNPNNALLMLGILKRDLSLLWPEYAEEINEQHQRVSQSLRQIALDMDNALIESGYDAVVNESNTVAPLTKGLLLPIFSTQEVADMPSLNILRVTTKAAPNQWAVDDFSRYRNTPFVTRWQTTLNSLMAIE
ncbi:hypothetical protein [Marinomonas algarum]|uniref:ABC transporter substrate-binding protein n=1 Tax=Marinomonas algarum TaxID=2883105 RepID=A0A9X1LFX3_9GAMM|nr:hypothetical protein [Marinomonas algarum]MCB5163230.1 hypothetical protein [Marinomonas algarum]